MRPIPPQRAEFQSAIEGLRKNLKTKIPELKEKIISIYKGLASSGFWVTHRLNEGSIYAYWRANVQHENDLWLHYSFDKTTGQTWAEVYVKPFNEPRSSERVIVYKEPVS